MPRYIPLQRQLHKQAGWQPVKSYSFTKDLSAAPLLMEELAHVMPHMAIAFSKTEHIESGYELVGIQSLHANMNLFVSPDGRWIGGYVPAAFRGYPFALLREEGGDNLHLCVDADSELFNEEAAEGDLRILTDAGEPAEEVAKVLNFLQQCHQNRLLTHKLVQQLVDNDLIQPWRINIKQLQEDGEAKVVAVEGLFEINKEALDALSPEKLQELHLSGALSMAYCQMWSKPRLSNLASLFQAHSKLLQQAQAQAQEPDLDLLFGEAEEDIFKF